MIVLQVGRSDVQVIQDEQRGMADMCEKSLCGLCGSILVIISMFEEFYSTYG